MRVFIILVGIPGSGKSTQIKRLGLEHLTLSPDELRIRNGALCGKSITPLADAMVWAQLRKMLCNRFKFGLTTIFDSTGLSSSVNEFAELAKAFRYRVLYVKFDKFSLEECVRNVRSREFNSDLPESVIFNFYTRMQNFTRQSNVCDSIESALKWENFYKISLDYDKIKVLPDLHGCYDTLAQFARAENWFKDESIGYVFLGDYIDRGNQNYEMVNFLCEFATKENVYFLCGNHDTRLFEWAFDINHTPPHSFKESIAEIETKCQHINELKKRLRSVSNKFRSYIWAEFKGEEYFFNHAGVEKMDTSLPDAYLLGVLTQGESENAYLDYVKIGNRWAKNHPNITQIFGHRNVFALSDFKINERCYCLECDIESGGKLAVLSLPERKLEFYDNLQSQLCEQTSRKSANLINEKRFEKQGIYSVNFSEAVFFNRLWTSQTIKARGLFRYINDDEIAGRSYDKFFNYEEFEGVPNLEDFKYPVKVWRKENGHLLLTFFNKFTKELEFATKSSVGKPMNDNAKALFSAEQIAIISEFCKAQNATCLWEVISKKDDKHPIVYDDEAVFLLNIVENVEQERLLDYKLADILGGAARGVLKDKALLGEISNLDELKSYVKDFFASWEIEYEGVVLEGANGVKLKLKGNFYQLKKMLRACSGGGFPKFSHSKELEKLALKAISLGLLPKWRELSVEQVANLRE